jgi:endonuclease/exonuclease/phosphatase (EEP) superfamily protein YafD
MMPGVTASPARRLVSVGGWVVVAPMLGFTVARLVHLDDHVGRLFALEVLTLWLLLPAYVVLVAAAATRRRALAGVALVVVLAHLAWVAPDLRWWPRERRAGRGPIVRVVSANVYAFNAHPRQAVARLAGLRPDVLVLVELNPDLAGDVARQPGLAGLRYRMVDPKSKGNAFGSGIYSRFPLSDRSEDDLAGLPLLSATVAFPSGPARVFAVHTLQPLAGLGVLRRQLAELDYRAERTTGPVILAGDFNATRQHRGFKALLQHGLRDAHLQRGRGRAVSWPTNRPGPPFALIDHVLVSHDLVVRDVRELDIPGSDHRAVVAQLRFSGR